jgi:succinate dehydrogenase / fumarate reductase, membrane anchor subunit
MDGQHMRSPLGRARGLGSAREGVEPWCMQRVTAVALIPLTLWLVASLIALTGSDYNAFIAWLKLPFVAILMVLLLIALFHHIALGLRVVVEDYVHSDRAKIPTVVAIRFACFALVVAGIFATVRIAFDG